MIGTFTFDVAHLLAGGLVVVSFHGGTSAAFDDLVVARR